MKYLIVPMLFLCGCFNQPSSIVEEESPVMSINSKMSDGATKIVDNLDKFDGKSLTGLSKGRLDADFNSTRIKIGIISSEINTNIECRYEEFVERHVRRSPDFGTVFGISFRKEF